jgi:ketosteroid isomerase-like protein
MRTTTFLKSTTFLLVFAALSCQQEKIDKKKEQDNLMQASRDWSAAAKQRDVKKVLDYWADNAVLISAGEPERNGKEALKEMVENSLKDPNFSIGWEPISAEVSDSGDMGYLLENTKITMKDSTGKEQVMNFRGITIWKKQKDGAWKNVVDILSPLAVK